jgi:hypothetical protein
MKTVTKSISLALLVATMASNALADGPRGHYPQSQHRNYQGRGHDVGWIAPLLFMGLAGAAIGAVASQQSAPPPKYVQPYSQPQTIYVQPAPVYMAPSYTAPAVEAPTPPPQPANTWYFCKSVGQYYPYTTRCPEGWQLTSPIPR